jgi:transposase InsO family protein
MAIVHNHMLAETGKHGTQTAQRRPMSHRRCHPAGGQYASKKYRAILDRTQMQQSMSRPGDCYDSALTQGCFGTIKTELEMQTYPTLEAARRKLEEYLNYCNVVRRHASLDYQSSTCFELALQN